MDINNDRTNDHARRSQLYKALAAHQQSEDWDGRAAVEILNRWTVMFVDEFKLAIPEIVIRVDVLPVSQLGSFRGEHNGLGLQYEVGMNSLYLNDQRPRWEPFATLVHQLLHAWQFSRGVNRPTYVHDAEYRHKATEIGLIVTAQGLTGCIPGGDFLNLLAKNNVLGQPEFIMPNELPEDENEIPPKDVTKRNARLKGESKLRKYSCGCTNVRVAKKEFRAICLLCGNEFTSELAEASGASDSPDQV